MRQAKQERFRKECVEIEELQIENKSFNVHKSVKELTGKTKIYRYPIQTIFSLQIWMRNGKNIQKTIDLMTRMKHLLVKLTLEEMNKK